MDFSKSFPLYRSSLSSCLVKTSWLLTLIHTLHPIHHYANFIGSNSKLYLDQPFLIVSISIVLVKRSYYILPSLLPEWPNWSSSPVLMSPGCWALGNEALLWARDSKWWCLHWKDQGEVVTGSRLRSARSLRDFVHNWRKARSPFPRSCTANRWRSRN